MSILQFLRGVKPGQAPHSLLPGPLLTFFATISFRLNFLSKIGMQSFKLMNIVLYSELLVQLSALILTCEAVFGEQV